MVVTGRVSGVWTRHQARSADEMVFLVVVGNGTP
jgi:hypothetical protein